MTAMVKRNDDVEQMTLGDALYSRSDQLVKIAGDALDVDRLFQLVIQSVDKTPALSSCSHLSVIRACYDAARLGLEMNGVEAALVPFKGTATCMPMYQGLVKLAYEEPTIASIEARVIREGDVYAIEEGTNPRIYHVPNLDDVERERKPARIWYAVCHIRGHAKFDYMTKAEIEALRLRSPTVRAGKSSPWDTDYNEMGKARIIKRLCKTLPKRPRLRDAIDHDDAIDTAFEASTITAAATSAAAAALGAGVAGALPPAGERPVGELAGTDLRDAISRAFDALDVPRGRRKEESRVWLGREPADTGDARELLTILRETAAERERVAAEATPVFVDDAPVQQHTADDDPPPEATP